MKNEKTTEAEDLAAFGSAAETLDEAELSTHKLRKPIKYDGVEIKELHFDFESLTGRDSREVIRELTVKGVNILASFKTTNEEYLRGMAARAITDEVGGRKIGADIFALMSAGDANRITTRVLRFL